MAIKILIFGAGAMGSLFGGLFAINNHDVTLLGRGTHIKAIHNNGLDILKDEESYSVQVKTARSLKEVKKNVDLIIIATKAFDLAVVCAELQKWRNKEANIVILQNGLGNEEIASNYLEKGRIYRILTSEGALIKKPGVVIKTGQGLSMIGRFLASPKSNEFIEELSAVITATGLPCKVVSNLQQAIWEKLVVNSSINPVGALTELTNGEIIKQRWGSELLRSVAYETTNVAIANGINFEIENPEELPIQVARATKDNYCSMLMDIKNGRQTEIKFINGAIVEKAQSRKIEVPLNRMLTTLVTLKEQKRN